MVGGYALTPNVSAEFWAEWQKQNADSPFLEHGLLLGVPTLDDARTEGASRDALRSGLEPMAPDGDPRAPRQIARDKAA